MPKILTNKMLRSPWGLPDPEQQNAYRACWAYQAFQRFAASAGLSIANDGLDTVISDLLADLGHLCDREGLVLADLLSRAGRHYNEETANDGEQFASEREAAISE